MKLFHLISLTTLVLVLVHAAPQRQYVTRSKRSIYHHHPHSKRAPLGHNIPIKEEEGQLLGEGQYEKMVASGQGDFAERMKALENLMQEKEERKALARKRKLEMKAKILEDKQLQEERLKNWTA